MGWRWVVTLIVMAAGSFIGGVVLHRGKAGAALGALAAGLLASVLWSKVEDLHINP
ncbi:MAG TPA: hypothetical protein VJ553_05095 [Candidatus Paceibacterota bacterium]|nr:hypothetical protein [Candidatus Paceibacterota bacterium]